jgi:hypothetical protein
MLITPAEEALLINNNTVDRTTSNYSRGQRNYSTGRTVDSNYRGSNTNFGGGSATRMNRTSPNFSRNQGQSQNNSNTILLEEEVITPHEAGAI